MTGGDLTRSQMMIWLGQKLNPEAPLYNMVHAFHLGGPVDAQAFARAFQAFVDRSDAFRTVIDEVEGVPLRRVLERVDAGVEHLDFSRRPDPSGAMQDWAQTRALRSFDLTHRLFDTALIRLADDRYVWYLNQHHLITDAWTTTLVFGLVSEYYERDRAGTLDEAPLLPTYRAFTEFERAQRDSPGWSRSRAYWQDRSEHAPPVLPALYGHAGVEGETRTHRVPLDLGADRSTRLRALAAEPELRALTPHLSLFNLFATVLLAFLYRVGGQRDLAIGTPSHNRPTPALKKTPGLFTEVLPLQVSVEDDDTFETLHGRVRAASTEFLMNARPGVSTPGLARGYNVVLNYINASLPEFQGRPVRNEWIHSGHGDPRQFLRLQVHDFEASGRFQLAFDLNGTAFDEALRRDAPGHFLRLLDALLADRTQRIGAPGLLSPAELDRWVAQWNDTETSAPLDRTVVDLFREQVGRTPDAVAVRFGSDTLTYAQLEARADRLAQELRSQGLRPEARVGLYARRSPELVLAILAVLEAGATYVPIDVDYPSERVAFMLDDAGASLLVTHWGLPVPPTKREIPILRLDDLAVGAREAAATQRAGESAGSGPAYVIYTSGSSGRPKGVVVEHRALVNYLSWAASYYGSGLAFPLFSSLSFDLTVTSIFVPLISGGEVVVYGEHGASVDLTLLDVLDDDAVDIVKLTPSHLELIKDRDLRQSRVRHLVVGGEDFSRHVAVAAARAFGEDATIYNEYGPTEATVGTVVHRFDPAVDTGHSVPVGRPVANTRVYLLDDEGQPVPRGVTGEIHIAGASLARGYWNRPELTADRFVSDPFHAGDRMYRTGDRARLNHRGELEYLGRRDQQVKIRGARIELGEVEAALRAHPRVRVGVVDAVASTEPPKALTVFHCVRCGLPDNYPGAEFDGQGTCHLCRAFDSYEEKTAQYFQTMDDLRRLFDDEPRLQEAPYDCVVLLSGGKDSTYVLARLVDLGLRALAFTLDNGFISDQAKANIRRVVEHLGVDHVFGTTPAMNEIFVDSLKRHSNVCHGCFKTIYTLSMQLAREKGVPFIVTGLSRGQFFETRLTEELFTDPSFDPDRIDRTILDARKAYHRVDDAVRHLLDVSMFDDDRIFDDVRFVDFYRYCDVGLDEMMAYLDQRLPWVRPTDTGRSTNCLINDVGIYVHKKERGYHNYAFPYSWDVRIGHKERRAALEELDDEIDVVEVRRILQEIGHEGALDPNEEGRQRLAAYYVADEPIPTAELRGFLADKLPEFMVPSHFIRLDELPLTPNGKVDRRALPSPSEERPELETGYVTPHTEAERILAAIWSDVIHVREVGAHDNFFDLGGDSIMAIQIVARANQRGVHLTPSQLFAHQTVAELAAAAGEVTASEAEQGLVTGPVPLTPVQRWFFDKELPDPNRWNQSLLLDVRERLEPDRLDEALQLLLEHHDALRLRFSRTDAGWMQQSPPTITLTKTLRVDLRGLGADSRARRTAEAEAELHADIDLTAGRLLRAALLEDDDGEQQLLMVIHHLAVDGVSWPLLLEDLQTAYQRQAALPPKTTSFKRWAEQVSRLVADGGMDGERVYWQGVLGTGVPPLPVETERQSAGAERAEAGTEGDARTTKVELDAEATRSLLHDVPAVYHTQINEVLLTGLALTLAEWSGGRSARIDLEGHGREEIVEGVNLSRTIGWFTSLFPVVLALGDAAAPGEALKTVKEQMRRIPNRGVGFSLLRYMGDASTRRELGAGSSADVLFNYLGRFDQPFDDASIFRFARPLSLSRDERGRRSHRLEINAFVTEGRLRAEWRFWPQVHRPATVRRLAERFRGVLEDLIRHCQAPGAGGFSPTDFPLATLDDSGLGKLARVLDRLDQAEELKR